MTYDYTNTSYDTATTNCLDYSDAKPQRVFDVIPKGTVAGVILNIRPGGYDDRPSA